MLQVAEILVTSYFTRYKGIWISISLVDNVEAIQNGNSFKEFFFHITH